MSTKPSAKAVQKIRIKLQAYEHRILDQSVAEILNTARKTGSMVAGPIPLPTRVQRYTVNRSPHVDKKSMDQFESRTHKRLMDIINPTARTVDELKKLNLPAVVDILLENNSNENTPVRGIRFRAGAKKLGHQGLFREGKCPEGAE